MPHVTDQNDRPTILVTGATGAQGGSVARHLLEHGRFAVRGITRNPDSPAAQALRQRGAEVVQADLADSPRLREVMKGCYGVYGVTNFWEHFEGEREHGFSLVDAVAATGVRHFVFSTLPSVSQLTRGELPVPHFDIKAEMEQYARSLRLPTTFVHLAYYFDNFLAWFAPRRVEDGTYRFSFPQGDTPLAGIGAEDVGGVVAVIFEQPEEFLGKTLYLVGDYLLPDEYAATMSRVTGRPVSYAHIPREDFAALGFPGAQDVANMFEYYRKLVPDRTPDLERTRELYPQVQTFETWLRNHRETFEQAMTSPS